MGSEMVRQEQARSWPTVQGTITRSEVEAVRSKGIKYEPKAAYTYSVDGQPYEGSKHRFGSFRSSESDYAEKVVARYPVGARVPVHYRPGQPSEAVLQPGVANVDLFLLLFLLPFNLVSLWMGAMVVRLWKPEPPLLSTFFQEDGSECVTLDEPWVISWACLAMTGAALVCAVLGASTGAYSAPLPVGIGAWGVVIASGVAAGLRVRAKQKSGHYDLRLHAQARTLSLPPFFRRKHRLDVRWRDVRSLRVETQVRQHKGRQSTHYQPTLELVTDGGGVRQEDIASFSRQDQAQALADWLRTHLKVGEAAQGELRSA
ncbi:DUF3592 domain-containing protein [Corallococcus exercitus]|uniref:DUF3592 domain-containing protein n=1 Tax=Corallococcus exercitus TaxID=2316736 RepID=UPI001FD2CDE7|nr:DUF3592 domain-containing protein [Corallococcus exercitus]